MSSGREQPLADTELVAYLDGEMPPEDSRALEQRLASDPALQKRLHEHQQVWELLDELPQAVADARTIQSTVEMVALSAAQPTGEAATVGPGWRRWWPWAACAFMLLAAALLTYVATRYALGARERRLLRELPILENLDAYESVDSIEFLRALDEEGLFSAEEPDAP